MSEPGPVGLEDARRRLKDLGYLDGRVERYVFSRALEGRGGLLLPAALLGAFAAALACVAAAAAGEPGFVSRPLGPIVLLLHLFAAFLPAATVGAVAVVAAADRVRAPDLPAAALAVAAAAGVFFLWIAGTWRLSRDLSGAALLWGFPVAVAALAFARSLRSGFLARSYAHSRALPSRRGRGTLLGAAAVGILVAAAVFAGRSKPSAPPPLHVAARQAPMVVVAIDGMREEDFASVRNPLRGVLSAAVSGWWREESGSPPELWTTLATGMTGARHGVRALERVRPAGSPSALRPPLGTAWYLRGVAPALRLSSSAPVSAADRSALAFWEVSASAGLPSAAIGWWASGPWPGAEVLDNRELLSRASSGEDADRIAIEEFSRREGRPIATVYLPGPDILRADANRREREIARIAAFVAPLARKACAGEIVLVALTADSHARSAALGRAAVFDGRPPGRVEIRATDVAPSLLARAGIPPAADLDGRPAPALFREGALETATVPTYGVRREPFTAIPETTDRDYLKKLKSLGYLN